MDAEEAELVVNAAVLGPGRLKELIVAFTTDDRVEPPTDNDEEVVAAMLLEIGALDPADDSELSPVDDNELVWPTLVEVDTGPGAVGTELLNSEVEDDTPLLAGPTVDPFAAIILDRRLETGIPPVE